jgi:hypothetical protein
MSPRWAFRTINIRYNVREAGRRDTNVDPTTPPVDLPGGSRASLDAGAAASFQTCQDSPVKLKFGLKERAHPGTRQRRILGCGGKDVVSKQDENAETWTAKS